ncbi:MAG: hypothetical protein JJT88_05175 [Gammaproteobacteria bacterium]|nr:hypothetical protein [Gammaproteobacteria bacterium]
MLEAEGWRNRCRSLRAVLGLLLISVLIPGCASPVSPDQDADGHLGEAVRSWPCERGVDRIHRCRLPAVDGFEPRPSQDSARFEEPELQAVITAKVVEGPAGAGVLGGTEELMQSWRLTLSPAVTWDQDPQGPLGFEVRGISGPERQRLDADPGQRLRQFHVVSYRNPRTGRVLVIEASAPKANWQEAWPRMAPVFSAVRLTREF